MSRMHLPATGWGMLPLDRKPWASQAHREVVPYPPPQQHEPQTWSMPALPAFPRWVSPGATLTSPMSEGSRPHPLALPHAPGL